MKIYKVGTRDTWAEHKGYSYHTNKREAVKASKESDKKYRGDIQELEIKLTKEDVLSFLNAYCSHPDNG